MGIIPPQYYTDSSWLHSFVHYRATQVVTSMAIFRHAWLEPTSMTPFAMTFHNQLQPAIYNHRGVKMFSTKTSRDVGMVDSVSDATGSRMERPTVGKSPGTKWCIQ